MIRFRLAGLLLATLMGAVPAKPQIVVIAHRGEHRAHPENTLPAFQAAVDAGADYFELDVRTTADGHLVLMHDATVDRTTNGSGAVRRLTLDQIRKLDAGAKFGPRFAGTRVPTLAEALRLARGRIGVYVDSKDIAPAELVSALTNAEMLDSAVIYGGAGFLRQVQALYPSLRVMPEAGSAGALEKLVTGMKLRVAAFDAVDFTDDVIAVAVKAGVAIYVDRLGPADNPAGWQDAVDRGAAGIQTDRPADLLGYLRSRRLHK
ncbi:MAG TPA: glycerophosphodiester phosphodiesterase family protein [Bryobacteraceae bacterium]|nr:glycerophosphodiester phosphodiesterase family protein [Bryobacteraceae bacterium]